MSDEQKGGAVAAYVSNLPTGVSDEAAAAALLAGVSDDQRKGDSNKVYMSFSGKRGRWTVGGKTPDPDALYFFEPFSGIEGWTFWQGGKVRERHLWSVFERETKAIPRSSLTEHERRGDGDGWFFTVGYTFADIDDPDTPIDFKINSVSGVNAVADFVKEYAARVAAGEPPIAIFAVGSEPFEAQGQWNEKPTFEPETWVPRAELEAFLAMEEPDVEALLDGRIKVEAPPAEEKPKPKRAPRAKKTKEDAAPADAEEPPVAPAEAEGGETPAPRRTRRSGRRQAA